MELGKEGRCWLSEWATPPPHRVLSATEPTPSTDCYVDLRDSPALLPSTPTMPLFPHVLDLLAPLDGSSRTLPSTEGLDDFSDADVFGPELDTLLDSLVSHVADFLFCPSKPVAHLEPTGHEEAREGPIFTSQLGE